MQKYGKYDCGIVSQDIRTVVSLSLALIGRHIDHYIDFWKSVKFHILLASGEKFQGRNKLKKILKTIFNTSNWKGR